MGNWSIYVSPEEENLLKEKIEQVARDNRWSFSQAVAGILREHLIEEKKRISDEMGWSLLTARSFFEGYSEKDAVYDDV